MANVKRLGALTSFNKGKRGSESPRYRRNNLRINEESELAGVDYTIYPFGRYPVYEDWYAWVYGGQRNPLLDPPKNR